MPQCTPHVFCKLDSITDSLLWKRVPYTCKVKCDWAISFLVNHDLIFLLIRSFHVHLNNFFSYLNMTHGWRAELKATRDSVSFAWWIFSIFFSISIMLKWLWLSFDQGFDRTWTLFGLTKVIKQTRNGSWTLRLYIKIRLIKSKKS